MDVKEYLDSVPDEKRESFLEIRKAIVDNLPEGFEETLSYGMLGYVVPLSLYPKGYRPAKGTPLPLIALAAQKQYISLYHLGLYGDPELLDWFVHAYAKMGYAHPLDMGKSCIRFRRREEIPLGLIGELAGKIGVGEWIRRYEESLAEARSGKPGGG